MSSTYTVSFLHLFASYFCQPFLETWSNSRKRWRVTWSAPRHSSWASRVEEIAKDGKVVFSSTFCIQMSLTCNFSGVCNQSTPTFWVSIISIMQWWRLCWRLQRKFESKSTPRSVYHFKGGIRNVYNGRIVVSQGFNSMCQRMYLKCNCWKSTESALQAAMMRKGPSEQLGSELDSETWGGFG